LAFLVVSVVATESFLTVLAEELLLLQLVNMIRGIKSREEEKIMFFNFIFVGSDCGKITPFIKQVWRKLSTN